MARITINRRRRAKANAAMRRRQAGQAHQDAVRQSRGLVFAGIGTCAATIALGIQIWQSLETQAINTRVLEGLALERIETLRGTGLETRDDWSYQIMLETGQTLDRISWRGLAITGGNIGSCDDKDATRSISIAADHSDTNMSGLTIHCKRFGRETSFERAVFGTVEFNEVRMTQPKLEGAKLVRVMFHKSRLFETDFSKADLLALISFEGGSLNGSSFNGATISNGWSSTSPVFSGVDLTAVDFRNAIIGMAGDEKQFHSACVDTSSNIDVGAIDSFEKYQPNAKNACICDGIDKETPPQNRILRAIANVSMVSLCDDPTSPG